jgi:hypothetical protein
MLFHLIHATMAVISSHICLRRLKHHHKNLARAFWCAIHFCRPRYLFKTRQEASRSIDTTKVKWPICKENWPKTNKTTWLHTPSWGPAPHEPKQSRSTSQHLTLHCEAKSRSRRFDIESGPRARHHLFKDEMTRKCQPHE